MNNCNPSATTSIRRLSASPRGGRSMSCTRTLVETRAPASRHTRATVLSNGTPAVPEPLHAGKLRGGGHRDRVDGRTGNKQHTRVKDTGAAFFWEVQRTLLGYRKLFLGYRKLFLGYKKLFRDTRNFFRDTRNFFRWTKIPEHHKKTKIQK